MTYEMQPYPIPEEWKKDWIAVAGCYSGPKSGYDQFLAGSCAEPYSTCPCVNTSMPKATTQALPTMTPSAREAAILPAQGALNPVSLVRPLPSIVTQAPIDMAPSCSTFAQWVTENKGIAVALLVGGALLAFGGKR